MDLCGTVELYCLSILREAAKEVCASKSARCFRFGEVGCVGVDVEDHIGGNVPNGGIFVGMVVVQELVDILVCLFCGMCLFRGDATEGD